MNDPKQRDSLLEAVPKPTLIRLLRSVALEYPDFVVRIDAATLADNPGALETFLSGHLDSLPRSDGWPPDDEGEAYTCKWIDPIIDAVREDLLPAAPAAAARILCQLITLDEEILQRIDSSYGCISIRLSWITDLLTEAARRAQNDTLAALRGIQRSDDPLMFRADVLRAVTAALPDH